MDELEFIWLVIEVWILPVIIVGGISLFMILFLWQININRNRSIQKPIERISNER